MSEILRTLDRGSANFAMAAGGAAVGHSVEGGEELLDFLLQQEEKELRWQERALCAQTDPEVFHPEKGGSTREAKRVCMACPVRAECLRYALDNDERFGVWGGLSERERRRLKHSVS